MAEITQTAILNVETSQSVKSVKDLKNQIKDLKDRIVELNAAGEDATAESTQLGNAMRQLKDLNEDAKRSSQDLGDQLSTAAGAMRGMAGAVSTVTGVLSLMGVESEKGTKLLKVMAAAMSITSGIQAMESGYKAVKSLIGGFRTATQGAKGLGQTLTQAFKSNPLAIILTTVVAITSALGMMRQKAKEASEAFAEQMQKAKEAARGLFEYMSENNVSMGKEWGDAYKNGGEQFAKTLNDTINKYVNAVNNTLKDANFDKYDEKLSKLLSSLSDNYDNLTAETAKATKEIAALYITLGQYTEEEQKTDIEAIAIKEKIFQKTNQINQKQIAELGALKTAYQTLFDSLGKTDYYYTSVAERLQKITAAQNEAVKKYNATFKDKNEAEKKNAEDEKKRAEERKRASSEALQRATANAKKQLELEKKTIDEQLKLEQAKAKRLYDLDVETATKKLQNGEITEKEYNDMLLQLDTQYYTTAQNQLQKFIDSMGALKEKYKDNKLISEEDLNNILPESVLENYLQQIDDARRALQNAVQENKTNTLEKEFAAKELQAETEKQNALNEITRDGFLQRYEIEKKYLSDSLLAFNDYIGQEKELINLELENENTRYNTISENLKSQMQMMQEKKDAGLITETEYNEGMAQLNQENFDNEQEHTEKIIELEQRKREVKKQTLEAATEIEKAAANASVEILNGLADYLGENNESYKGLKIAAALIDTIQGAISAFTAAQSIPPPYGQIVGAVNAAAVTAMGMMNIAKIKQINPKGENGGTSATPASSSVQTFTTPTTATIATGATNDFTNMMGEAVENANQNNKVYVVLNDINEAESRRVSVTNSNTF